MSVRTAQDVAREILSVRPADEYTITDDELANAALLIDEYAKLCIEKACEGTERMADMAMVQAQGMKQTALTMRSFDIRAAQNAAKGMEQLSQIDQLKNIGKS